MMDEQLRLRTGNTKDGKALDAISMFDDEKRGLAAMVVEDEHVCGNTDEPRLADDVAAEYVSRRQPDEDLGNNKPLG